MELALERKTNGGYTVVEQGGRHITELRSTCGREVQLGDIVVSAGRVHYLPPRGTRGVVFEIIEPHTAGYTSDVIGVRWTDGTRSHVKFKDLMDERPETLA
ncbi:MAG: hypothetical protein BWY68_00575 [bacterium ADurb.Bin400]|nr:MAG: hypothetical protein BWY68_00575 [bacterium ADurb.Bin400]